MSEFVDSTRSPRELGVLHQYIEERRDAEMTAQLVNQLQQRFVTPEDLGRFQQGVSRHDFVDIPGYVHNMERRQLLQLGLAGNLDLRQTGALFGHLIHRAVVALVRHSADRALNSEARFGAGILRADRIQVPGVPADAPYEELLANLLYSTKFTDTQRGALAARLAAAATPVVHELGRLTSRIDSLRMTVRGNIEFEYGVENAEVISGGRLGAETPLISAIRATIALPTPTTVGAAWARVTPRIEATQSMAVEVARVIPRMQSIQHDFAAGFANAPEVELPGFVEGTSLQSALAYYNPDFVPLQSGAIYKRLLDQLAMETVEWHLRGYMERDAAGDMTRGYADPDPDSVPGLPYPFALQDIATRLAHGDLTLEQAGMLQYFTGELASDLRVARIGAIRHRLITGPQFAEYVHGYLNPPADEADFLQEPGASVSMDSLHAMFVDYAANARRRGEIARYMARFDSESENAIYQEAVLARVFAAAQATQRIPFAQTLIPSMLKGLVGGDCFSCSLIMSVAMWRGTASVNVFSRRMRAFETMRTPPAGADRAGAPHTLPLESRNVLSALASLALRQPGSSGELIAGEMTRVASGVDPRSVGGIVHVAAQGEGHENYVMVTSEHAMALRVVVDHGDPRTALSFLFYEPNYGLLEFDTYERFDHALRIVSEAPYYRRDVFGDNPRVDVYRVNIGILERVKVCGNLRVIDLVHDRPFLRARDHARVHGGPRGIHGRHGTHGEVQARGEAMDADEHAAAGAVDADAQAGVRRVDADTLAGADVRRVDADTQAGAGVRRVDADTQAGADVRRVDADTQAGAGVRRVDADTQAGVRVVDADAQAGVRVVDADAQAGVRVVNADTQAGVRVVDADTQAGVRRVDADTQIGDRGAMEVDTVRIDAGAQTDERRGTGTDAAARVDSGTQTDAHQAPEVPEGGARDASGSEPEQRRRRSLGGDGTPVPA